MKFEMWKAANKNYYWHLKAANGQIIATGGEGYINRADCIAAVSKVMATNNQTPFTGDP